MFRRCLPRAAAAALARPTPFLLAPASTAPPAAAAAAATSASTPAAAAPAKKKKKSALKAAKAAAAAAAASAAPAAAATPAAAAAGEAKKQQEVAAAAAAAKKVKQAEAEAEATAAAATAAETAKEKPTKEKPAKAAAAAEAPSSAASPSSSSSSASAAAAAPPAGGKTAMVKGYRMEEVLGVCSVHDAVFARRLPTGGYQFFAWPGTPAAVTSAAILSMPDTIRTVHAVFGRPHTPIDLVIDIDCPVPQENWSMDKIRPFQLQLLDEHMVAIHEELVKLGVKVKSQVVLQSPNLKKASFHVHTKLKDAAFKDFNSLHGFLAAFHHRIPKVDLQIYRPNGMLRMYGSLKENHTSAMQVFDDPKWQLGFRGKLPTPEAAALHSVVVRGADEPTGRLLEFAAPRGSSASVSLTVGADGKAQRVPATGRTVTTGDGSTVVLPVAVPVPLTEAEAVGNASRWLRAATEAEVSEWRAWIGLGICAFRIAHHFRDAKNLPRPAMEEMLDAWGVASRSCAQKYHQGECARKWSEFDISRLSESNTDWWTAYVRLGRLQVAAQENLAHNDKVFAQKNINANGKQSGGNGAASGAAGGKKEATASAKK